MTSVVHAAIFVVLAPFAGGLLAGIDRIITARMQGRVGPPLLQPFFDVGKLLQKKAKTVNPLAEPLVIGHLVGMALTGALVLGNADLLFTAFIFALAALFLVLAASSSDSPFGFAGAERELIIMLASEPAVILLLAMVCKVTGQFTFHGVLSSKVMVAEKLPGIFLAFLFIISMKLRKSPFDISVSHHAHQELVKGLTTDLSGRLLAYVELAHWYESMLLGAFVVLSFNWSVPLGVGVALVAYFFEILVDASTSRMKWQLLLGSSWGVTLLLSGGNIAALYLLGR